MRPGGSCTEAPAGGNLAVRASRGQSCRSHSTTLLLTSSYLLDSLCYLVVCLIFYATKMRLWDLPRTEQDAILYFQERNILPKKRKCGNSHEMIKLLKTLQMVAVGKVTKQTE